MSKEHLARLASRKLFRSCRAAPISKGEPFSFWPFTRDEGDWRLVTLDFGVEAQRHECEFLMCFAFQVGSGVLSVTGPYVEIGFSLPVPTDEDPVFVLTVRTAVGFPI